MKQPTQKKAPKAAHFSMSVWMEADFWKWQIHHGTAVVRKGQAATFDKATDEARAAYHDSRKS